MPALTRLATARARRLLRRDQRERGAATLMVAVLGSALIMMAGLVYDGATKLQAARHATSSAGESARAAGQQLDPDVIGGGTRTIDPTAAVTAARAYLDQAGVTGTVTVNDDTITVSTSQTWTPAFLSAIGVGPQTVTGHATAHLDRVLNGVPR